MVDGQRMKAWRAEKGLSQQDGADELGIKRAALASYESGRRPVPPEIMEKIGAPQPDPPPPADAPPVVKAVAQLKGAAVRAGAAAPLPAYRPDDMPPKHLAKQGARRPTPAEVRAHPGRFAGPDVWIVTHNPPIKHESGSTVRLVIWKYAANGQGLPSCHLVGSTRNSHNVDREALPPGVYRPAGPTAGHANPRNPEGSKGRGRQQQRA